MFPVLPHFFTQPTLFLRRLSLRLGSVVWPGSELTKRTGSIALIPNALKCNRVGFVTFTPSFNPLTENGQ